ncbi:isopropanol dehydrogenase, putative [Talaromyces stipitatus ATCC 10500]|uniref:Isopropanol dehydrogenase, putative n=1 Tax=Talaromyces stipitatus (strain ATCC 10500 / CBS 375.48 / QM 6759 / NRRL 1006) TaxID=441959 RepID=B8MF51_TALSN|nr:isopropanol dehydrogenase, putative [Talaromyces stipitatus ATCC 10500]EED16150.1 isopropanol dehydrogenase, putative [Talaromyces stipitatus ATCC 10500]
MATHKALILRSRNEPLTLETVLRPVAKAGQAVIRTLAADIVPYMHQVLHGSRRVVEVGPDAVKLSPGQLVFCDITIRARDDPNVSILFGIHGGGYPAAQKLMDGEWRNATYAEYTKFPLENLYPLNEDVLFNRFGYAVSDLCLMPVCLVPFGGLSEVNVNPGEVVIVAPATGRYGGATVAVALAMGATVVAAGRNKNALEALEATHASTGRLQTVILTEDTSSNAEAFKEAAGKPEGADVYIDFSPPTIEDSALLVAAVGALRSFGRFVLMGGHSGNINVPYLDIMFKSIRIQGRFMYSRQHVLQMIQMVESGVLKLGSGIGIKETQEFGLESVGDALQAAGRLSGFESHVVLKP